jgi:hypothetical protein
MKSFHLTAKFACAVIATAAVLAGCQKKDADVPPPAPEVTPAPAAAPAPTTPPVTNTPTTEGGTATQPDPNAPPAGTTPATPVTTPPPANR